MNVIYKNILLFVLVFCAATLSYTYFVNYRPNSLKQGSEVKGYRTIEANSLNLPYPEGSEKIGITHTAISEQITFQAGRDKNEIHGYYKNILISKNWELENENLMDDFTLGKYELEEKSVTVLVLDQKESNGIKSSLVSIEIVNED